MSSEVKIRSNDCMESKDDNESLQARIREVEDENQELRAQTLLQNRTITELRNELVLLRIQMSELTDTSALLRERVRTLVQNAQQRQQQQQQENEGNAGPVTTPPLMAPPPVPPPLPPARIRISPRQVGAGEALTTPLGVSLSSPPRHRVKRDYRQGFYKTSRIPYRRMDGSEPGPSSQTPLFTPERPNYFVGLKIIPQFQSFLCSNSQSGFSDSASDSSGSDENLQLPKKSKLRPVDGESAFKNPSNYSKDFELLKNVRNLHHQKVRQSVLQNYNLSLANNSKFFFPMPWDKKTRENQQPSTSGNEVRFFQGATPGTSDRLQTVNPGSRNPVKVSDCIQYTFPAIHEGLHNTGITTVLGNPTSRLRKFKKNIPYLPQTSRTTMEDGAKVEENGQEAKFDKDKHRPNPQPQSGVECESFSSIDDVRNSMMSPSQELPSDFEQDGFQADESSNCLTSADNSLEQICISQSKNKKRN